jgi:hypothetical protein
MGVETHKGPDGGEQELSVAARRAKQARDKAYAMTENRKKKKRDNQTFVDADGNKGQKSNSDIHHTKSGTQRRTSIAFNRASHSRDEVKT